MRALGIAVGWLATTAVHAQEEAVAPLEPVSSPYLLKLTGGLILVVFVIVVLAWLVKKLNLAQQSGQGLIRVVAGLSLGTRDRIVLLQVGEEQILVGLSPGRIEKLHTLAQPLDVPDGPAVGANFADRFNRLMGDREAS